MTCIEAGGPGHAYVDDAVATWGAWQSVRIPAMGEATSLYGYPLVICYIAIENGHFIVDFPIKNGGFP